MKFFSQTITGHQPGPHVLILAGVHGDEYEPIAAVRQLITEVRAEELKGQVTLVPILNEPAFRNLSRTGPDGLDLARTMPGHAEGSVTEQIACEAATLIRSSDYLIDLHTGGLAMRISPLAGYMLHDDPEVLSIQRKMATAFNLPIVWGTSAALNGRTLSVARDARIPAIYTEWGGGGGCNPDGVQDDVNGCLNVLHELGMIERHRPINRVRLLVEDRREESGVFQKNSPALHAGYFEAAVKLDDVVQIGDRIGWVHSLNGEPSTEVTASESGTVILLRAIPAVKQGDCLVTILATGEQPEVDHV